MQRPVVVACVGLTTFLATLAAVGCGSAAQHAGSEAPGDVDGSTGTLVARVAGNPRDIRYFINGKHFEPEHEIEWWRDARLEVDLAPGAYQIEAEYIVRAFAGDGETYRITTEQPVEIRAGQVTLLYANLNKDYRGVPEQQTEVFSVLHPTRSPESEDEPVAEPHGALHGMSREDVRFASASAEGTTILIRNSSVSERSEPDVAVADENETRLESWRVRARTVERGVSLPAALVDPEGGSALQVHGSQVRQSTAPQSSPPPDANTPPMAIEIRGTSVQQRAAPPPAEPPGADARVESIRIRGTRIETTPSP